MLLAGSSGRRGGSSEDVSSHWEGEVHQEARDPGEGPLCHWRGGRVTTEEESEAQCRLEGN